MGGVFLRRPFRAPAEVINDAGQDVATLFRILQRHYVPFLEMLRWQVTSRAEFERLAATDAATLTDLERAARFLYLQRTAFGGKVVGQNFGVSVGLPGRFDITRLSAILEAVHERLAGVIIERLPYAEMLARYDRPDTLFHLDPPYWGCSGTTTLPAWPTRCAGSAGDSCSRSMTGRRCARCSLASPSRAWQRHTRSPPAMARAGRRNC